ncbi:ABC transporter permease [Candidatus Latescibacterota bacterium]
MLRYIILREIKHNVLSLRLHIAFLLTITVFCLSTIVFVKNHADNLEKYKRDYNEYIENMRETAESNLSSLAVRRRNFILEPRNTAFITDAKEKYTPNRFQYSAYNVFGYDVTPGSANPYLNPFQELNWAFIVSIIISFTVFLFTFDSISGEKQSRTLAVSLANSISRGTLIFGKYLSTILSSVIILIPGICISLVIILLSGTVALTTATLGEIFGFLTAVVLFTACIAAFGMFASVLSHSARVSLVIALSLWLIFAVLIPSTAVFWSTAIFPIDKAETVDEKVTHERNDINTNAPEGSWSSSSNNPFLPQHELRAANQTNLMNSEKRIRDAYYHDRFRQFERVRLMTLFSPVSLFEYISEAVVGGGYVQFQKTWNDLHVYQEQFLAFFKEKDASDPDSPHWYNPYEDLSTTRKPANFEELPLYKEKVISIDERIMQASIYLLVMVVYTALVFFLTFVLFVRYDVR